ncbi:hypothetical protein ONZ45_g8322 [Pleurotus djamor]|nr:hypothetical protein ONZ45_g8322 [Pleurotus djamor]
MTGHLRTILSSLPLVFLPATTAKLVNVTVDDRYGPDSRPGNSLNYSDGWTETGIDRCQIGGNSDMTFLIDGDVKGTFKRPAPDKVTANTPVFILDTLTMGEHALTIQNGNPGVQEQVVMLLDYVIFTTDDGILDPGTSASRPLNPSSTSAPQSTPSTSTSATPPLTISEDSQRGFNAILNIAVPITAAASFLILVTLLWIIWTRRRRPNQAMSSSETVDDDSASTTSSFYHSGASFHTQYSATTLYDEPSDTGAIFSSPMTSSSNCKADATFGQAYHQTWTKALFDPNGDSTIKTASILFNGTTISVYCITTSVTDEGFQGNSDMVFLIDGELAGNFQRQRPSSSSPNLLVFRSQSLEMGEHTLTIQNGRPETQQQVVMLLDYIEYTTDDGSSPSTIQTPETGTGIPMPSPSATSNNKSHNIALIAVPSVIAFIVLSGLIFTIHRIRRRRAIESETLPSSHRWNQSKPTHSSHPSSTTSLMVPYPLHQVTEATFTSGSGSAKVMGQIHPPTSVISSPPNSEGGPSTMPLHEEPPPYRKHG